MRLGTPSAWFLALACAVASSCSGNGGEVAPDGRWGDPSLLELDDTVAAGDPHVAVDPSGNATAVWHQSNGTRSSIWANRFTPSGGWQGAELVETEDAVDAYFPRVAADPNGDAVAVWYQSDGTRSDVWSNRYSASAGWGPPERIDNIDIGDAMHSRVVIDASGNVIAAWTLRDDTLSTMWSNRHTAVDGWGVPQHIPTRDRRDAFVQDLAVDPNGNAFVVFGEWNGRRYRVTANRFTPGDGWGAAVLLEGGDTVGALAPSVAADADGNAVAVWSQSDGVRAERVAHTWAARFTRADGWGTSVQIERNDEGDAYDPHVAVDPAGNAVAVWAKSDRTRFNVWANRFTPSSGWGEALRIEDNDAYDAVQPRVAVDSKGTATAVWNQPDFVKTNIWSNRWTSIDGWGAAVPVERNDAREGRFPQLGVDAGGNVVVVWSQAETTRLDAWANRFERTELGGE